MNRPRTRDEPLDRLDAALHAQPASGVSQIPLTVEQVSDLLPAAWGPWVGGVDWGGGCPVVKRDEHGDQIVVGIEPGAA